jgi:alcohol dehydrogenase, propanol-preferring
MTQTMRAALLPGVGAPLELVQRPLPVPGPGEVRVRIDACGVCGSDLFLQKGGFGVDKLPVVPGHEAAGTVDALGPGVSGWSEGDQAALYYIDSDPDGSWAAAGREHLDPELRRMGVDVDGAFADYVVRPVHTLIRTPAPVDPVALAVLTDAVATPYHALVRVARLQAGETLLVLGVGGIGSNAVQIGRHLGARVVCATRSDAKLALARELGAAELVQTGRSPEEDAAAIRAACGPHGPDVVLQCVGSAALDELAIAVAAPAGRVVFVGAAVEPFSVRAVELIWRELALLGSRGFTRRDIAEVVELYRDRAIRVDHLTTTPRPLEEANAALEDLAAGRVLRSVLCPTLPATAATGAR